MQPEDIANLATGVALLATSGVAMILGARMKKPMLPALQRGVRILQVSMLLLASFLLVHGLYHASEFVGNDFLSDDILEPASIMLLLGFSVYVWKFIFIPRPASSSKKSSSATPLIPNKSARVGAKAVTLWFASPLIGSFAAANFFQISSMNLSINPPEFFSLFGILLAAGLFSWMAIKNPSSSSLHFQFFMITIIWAAAEVPHILSSIGFIQLSGFDDVYGTWVHFASMTLIGAFVCYRLISLQFKSPFKPGVKTAQLKQSVVRRK